MTSTSKSKYKKKNVSLGIVHIKATFNNTIVTITDVQGNVIVMSGAGTHNFKGAKKATPYAAQVIMDSVATAAKGYGLKTVSIRIKGSGSQREAAMRAVLSNNFVVTSITDVSGVAHNGVKPPKRRRT